ARCCSDGHPDALHPFPTRRSSDLSGETVEVADAIRDASGRLRTLSAQIVPETGLSGAVHGFFYVALDTTEREAAAQALREGEERSEEHTSELQSRENLVCRLLLEK